MAILDQAGPATRTVRTFCSLCKVICPAVVTVEGSVPIKLEPDREHARGGAVCAKGRAAPEIHDHPNRVNYPLRRTRPKTDPDPGWERCTWDEALDLIAAKLSEIRETSGPQAVAFSRGTGSATGVRDTDPWFTRLANHFGTPNMMSTTHVCNWSRDGASYYTWGLASLPMPQTENSRLHRALGHQPERDPAWPRPRRDRGTRPGRPAGGRRPAPGRRGEQGRPGAPGAPRHGRRPRAGDDRRADPGRPVRRVVRARVDQRAAAGPRGHRPAARRRGRGAGAAGVGRPGRCHDAVPGARPDNRPAGRLRRRDPIVQPAAGVPGAARLDRGPPRGRHRRHLPDRLRPARRGRPRLQPRGQPPRSPASRPPRSSRRSA